MKILLLRTNDRGAETIEIQQHRCVQTYWSTILVKHFMCAIASVALLSERLNKHLSCSLADQHDFLRILVLFSVIGSSFDVSFGRLQSKIPFVRPMRCAHCMTQANYNEKHHTFKRNDKREHYFESRLQYACSSNGGQRPQQPYKSSWLPGTRSMILIDLHAALLRAASIAFFVSFVCVGRSGCRDSSRQHRYDRHRAAHRFSGNEAAKMPDPMETKRTSVFVCCEIVHIVYYG